MSGGAGIAECLVHDLAFHTGEREQYGARIGSEDYGPHPAPASASGPNTQRRPPLITLLQGVILLRTYEQEAGTVFRRYHLAGVLGCSSQWGSTLARMAGKRRGRKAGSGWRRSAT